MRVLSPTAQVAFMEIRGNICEPFVGSLKIFNHSPNIVSISASPLLLLVCWEQFDG